MVSRLSTATSSKMYPTTRATSSLAALLAPATPDAASQVDPRTHHPRVQQLVRTPISYGVIDYFLNATILAVAHALLGPLERVAFRLKTAQTVRLLTAFIECGGFRMQDVLVALVFLERVRPHLDIDAEEWVCERLGVGALISAYKYLNDALPPKSASTWARCTGQFSMADINRIEREFLALLNFDMRVTDADLLLHVDGLAAFEASHQQRASCLKTTAFARRERAEYRYPIHPRSPSPPPAPAPVPVSAPVYAAPSPMMSSPAYSPSSATHWSHGTDLPELMYPDSDSPASSASSSASSAASAPVVTPPDARPPPGLSLPKRETESQWGMPPFNPVPSLRALLERAPTLDFPDAARPATRAPRDSAPQYDPGERERERILACARWYTGRVSTSPHHSPSRNSYSPRFAPFSPPTARYETEERWTERALPALAPLHVRRQDPRDAHRAAGRRHHRDEHHSASSHSPPGGARFRPY
ncbi:hypothetical protein C2E23DRAFT_902798 [Lenzites betulinus]|nr:hypothetical protein C2E23DRAFT_902798 [Lenzites betulinus]